MNTPLISDVSNGTAKIEIEWETLRQSLPKGVYNTLIVSQPNDRIPQITYNMTQGVEPVRKEIFKYDN